MRILQSGIYNNFIFDQSNTKKELDKVTNQISSGKLIQHSYDDSFIYSQTLKLDSQIDQYKDIQDRVDKSKMLTDTSDSALASMNDSLRNIHTKLLQASSETLSSENLKSISISLKNEKENLIRLANTSINGEYLFSGTAINQRPIDDNGEYQGGDMPIVTELAKGKTAQVSVAGSSIFFGIDNFAHKEVVSNVILKNQDPAKDNQTIKIEDTIADLTGENGTSYFYLNGKDHDGRSIKSKISLDSNDKVSDLIDKIRIAYGEDSVDVKLTNSGVISITDKIRGNSKLDFQMISSTQNVSKIRDLTTKFNFNKSNDKLALEGVEDSSYFKRSANTLSSNLSLLSGDKVATSTTKLSQISNSSIDGSKFKMKLTDINGDDKSVLIDLSDSSTFTIDGTSYNIYNANSDEITNNPIPTKADDFTLGQLESIISLAMSGKIPASNSKDSIEDAIIEAKKLVNVELDRDGKLKIVDQTKSSKDIKFSIYDEGSDDMSKSNSISFNTNSAIIASNPQTNLFKDLDEIINAVDNAIKDPGADLDALKNITINQSIDKIDRLSNNINNAQSTIGALSNSLERESQKASALEMNVTELRSKISDTDIAEAMIEYQQISLNYQAMMSTISKVNSLSLLNYIK